MKNRGNYPFFEPRHRFCDDELAILASNKVADVKGE